MQPHNQFAQNILKVAAIFSKSARQGKKSGLFRLVPQSGRTKYDFEKDSELDEIATKSTMTDSMVNFRGRLMLAHLFITKLKQLKGSLT